MKGKAFVLFSLGLSLVATMLVQVPGTLPNRDVQTGEVRAATRQRVVEAYGKLPLSFEANQGQTGSQVKFLARGSGYRLFLTPTEAVLSLSSPQSSQRAQRKSSNFLSAFSAASAVNDPNPKSVARRMKLVGANPAPQVEGLEELPGKSNYFIGNDPEKWRTNVPTYAKVQYKDVYPGVDLVYYGNQRQLEYDLVVAPGADPEAIQLAFEGEDKLEIDAQGDLVLDSGGGQVRLHKPLVYQEVDGVRREISGAYVLNGGRQVGFEMAAYDTREPLIIDPVLEYSTYLGGSVREVGDAIAVDASGSAYVTGETNSTDFPTASAIQPASGGGTQDAFVAKLNAAGNALVYSTYLGGSGGDSSRGIAVDAAGNAYVTGHTQSTNFPTTAGAFQTVGFADAFVAKLNAAGNTLVYSTYLGSSSDDSALGIAVDSSGNAHVTGFTGSTDFPTENPFQAAKRGRFDAFIAKITDPPPGPSTPILPSNSVVNGASFRPATEPNSAVAPGGIVAIFGTDLASDTVLAQEVPLLTTLGDTSVTFNDISAPLFFVSGPQINAQVPFELMTGTGTVMVQVKRGSETSEAQPIGIATVSPGIFTLNEQGTGAEAILHADDFQPVSESAPAQPGEFLLIFCTGLGPVMPEVPSGNVAPSTPPLAETMSTPLVNIAGIPALVTFSGLAPGFVGLYQVNVQVALGVPSGTQNVEIIINGVPSNIVTVPVSP